MSTQSEVRRSNGLTIVAIAALMIAAWMVAVAPSSAAPAADTSTQAVVPLGALLSADEIGGQGGNIFAKYDGVDGESLDKDHRGWIDVLSVTWGAERADAATGQSRRRGAPVIEDLVLTFEYEKASPVLEEKLLKGEVIPKLEIDFTATSTDLGRLAYLTIELTNVMLTTFDFEGMEDFGPPTVVFGNNFEEIKVTYTELDDDGSSSDPVTYEYSVEQGK